MYSHDRRRRDALRADRDAVLAAAVWLRHEAVQEQYAGLQHPERAYALASVLELVATRMASLDPPVRAHVVRVCRELVGNPMDRPAVRRTRRR